MNERALKLANRLGRDEAYYVTNEHAVRYLSGFSGEGSLLITNEQVLIITDFRYTEAAGQLDGVYVYDIAGGIGNAFPKHIHKVRISEPDITLSAFKRLTNVFPEIEFVSDEGEITKCRMVKSASELACIRRASAIAEHAFEEVLNIVKAGVTEKQLAFEFEWLCRRAGAEGLSFDTVVASGENSSMPHAVVSKRKLQNGDFITFDFGCIVDGYCSDMTRTVALKSCSEEMREIYSIVLKAQLAGVEAVRAGVPCKEADATARSIIEAAGYGEYFGHSLGHGVGLEVHEAPNLSPKSAYVLEKNMVVSVEPGIYLPGKFGVRIEDLVVVGGENCEILTKKSKELCII